MGNLTKIKRVALLACVMVFPATWSMADEKTANWAVTEETTSSDSVSFSGNDSIQLTFEQDSSVSPVTNGCYNISEESAIGFVSPGAEQTLGGKTFTINNSGSTAEKLIAVNNTSGNAAAINLENVTGVQDNPFTIKIDNTVASGGAPKKYVFSPCCDFLTTLVIFRNAEVS